MRAPGIDFSRNGYFVKLASYPLKRPKTEILPFFGEFREKFPGALNMLCAHFKHLRSTLYEFWTKIRNLKFQKGGGKKKFSLFSDLFKNLKKQRKMQHSGAETFFGGDMGHETPPKKNWAKIHFWVFFHFVKNGVSPMFWAIF